MRIKQAAYILMFCSARMSNVDADWFLRWPLKCRWSQLLFWHGLNSSVRFSSQIITQEQRFSRSRKGGQDALGLRWSRGHVHGWRHEIWEQMIYAIVHTGATPSPSRSGLHGRKLASQPHFCLIGPKAQMVTQLSLQSSAQKAWGETVLVWTF